MTATPLLTCGQAACAANDIWFDSILFATARATLEARGGKLAELSTCRLCLSFHAAWLAVLLLAIPRGLDGLLAACEPYTMTWAAVLTMQLVGSVGELLVAALAVSKLARWISDHSDHFRTPVAGGTTTNPDLVVGEITHGL